MAKGKERVFVGASSVVEDWTPFSCTKEQTIGPQQTSKVVWFVALSGGVSSRPPSSFTTGDERES